MRQSRKRKSAKISDAVFRGKKGDYTFEVYPFGADIPETPAVFIFSRRKVHRTGRVSHAASCIGETDSLPAELKKHKRAKCVKTNESNVVCVLRDENGRHRLAVLSDITEARTFGCVRNVYEPNIMPRPDALHIAAAKHADPKPVRRRKIEEPKPDEAPVKQTRRKRALADEPAEKPKAAPKKKAKTHAKAKPAPRSKAKPIRKVKVKAEPVRKAGTIEKARAKAKPVRAAKSTAKPVRKTATAPKPSRKTSISADKPRTSKPKSIKPKTARSKATKPVRAAAPPARAASAAKRTTAAAAAKRTKPAARSVKPGTKPTKPAAKKPAAKAAKPAAKPVKQSTAKPRKTKPAAKAKPTTAAARPRARVSGGVDRDRGKHRLPEQKRPARGRAKAGTAKRAGARKKASA